MLPPVPAPPEHVLIVHGFRAPLMGVELKEGPLGFSVGAYPTVLGTDAQGQPVTTWFLKTGLTAYAPESGPLSGLYGGLSLLQGLSTDWGTAGLLEVGYRLRVWRGLELRLGAGALLAADGRFRLNPMPGIGWNIPL